MDKSEPLKCPETIKSPTGKYPATEWRLEALGEKAVNEYYGRSEQPNSWTVKLTLISKSEVWARVQLQTKVNPYCGSPLKYDTRTVPVAPSCNAPHTVRVWPLRYFTGYIPLSRVGGEDISHEYLYYKDLIIYCDVTVTHLDHPIHATCTAAEAALNVPSFNLSTVMEDARHKNRYTDVTIETREKEFKAHKVVLACQSTFFETCLEERWKKEGNSDRIEMLDVPEDTMDAILTYMYTGKVKDIDKTAYDLLPKANEYQLEGLKVKCEEALINALTPQTVIDILLMADMHSAQKLKESCMFFIAKNIVDVKGAVARKRKQFKFELHNEGVSETIVRAMCMRIVRVYARAHR